MVLTDFERTLVRLFEDHSIEQDFLDEVRKLCRAREVPASVLNAAGGSPYSIWMEAHRWMKAHRWKKDHRWKRKDPLRAEKMYHALTRIAMKFEMEAAEDVRLFKDVQPVLERLEIAGIPVVIVSNNATAAVERILEKNGVRHLVADILGREFKHEMIDKLKPRPNLLVEALKRAEHAPGTALLVGDSVDDMRAGQAAKIRFRVGLLQHSTASEDQLHRAGAQLVLNRFGDLEDHPDLQRLLFGTDVSGVR